MDSELRYDGRFSAPDGTRGHRSSTAYGLLLGDLWGQSVEVPAGVNGVIDASIHEYHSALRRRLEVMDSNGGRNSSNIPVKAG